MFGQRSLSPDGRRFCAQGTDSVIGMCEMYIPLLHPQKGSLRPQTFGILAQKKSPRKENFARLSCLMNNVKTQTLPQAFICCEKPYYLWLLMALAIFSKLAPSGIWKVPARMRAS